MLTPEEIAAVRDMAGRIADPINDYLLEDIARRISEAGQLTSTASYQVWRAQQLGMSQRQIKKELRRIMNVSHRDLRKLLTQSAEVGYNFDISNLPYVQAAPFEQNEVLQQIVSAAVKLAQDDFTNITQTLGMIDPNGNALPLRDAYRSCMDFAFKQVSTGAADYNTAIRQACRNLADKGVQWIDYESGVHTSLEAAVRRSVMGGLGLMQEQISQANHDDLGADGWEISAHANSAPDHEPIQGRQYSDAEYEALNNSLMRRIGTLNCGHAAFPIILGVNVPQYTPAELAKFREDNEKGITYQGRHYTGYEATQMQRKLERSIRKQKNRILVDGTTGDGEKLQADRIRLRRLNEEYRRFSKVAGLRTQPERAQVSGFGRGQAARAAKAGVAVAQKRATIDSVKTNSEETNVQEVARIDLKKYELVAKGIRSDKVVLTSNQQEHIIKRRGEEFFKKYEPRFKEIAEDPDCIFLDKQHLNTAIACKSFVEDGKSVHLVIKLALESDDPKLENSIITALLESNKRFAQRLRNNVPLYKKE
jgi:hypothetical protein